MPKTKRFKLLDIECKDNGNATDYHVHVFVDNMFDAMEYAAERGHGALLATDIAESAINLAKEVINLHNGAISYGLSRAKYCDECGEELKSKVQVGCDECGLRFLCIEEMI